MLNIRFLEAVYGMLYFYGIIPINDVFETAYKCGLCTPADYKVCLDIISYNLTKKKRMYISKNKLCHRLLKNKNTVEDMQDHLKIASYKMFTADEFIEAGLSEIMINNEMRELITELKQICSMSWEYVEGEVLRVWTELNNMPDLICLTEECIDNLDLNITRKDFKFLNILNYINKFANNMPRWFCKGYSYNETIYKNKNIYDQEKII